MSPAHNGLRSVVSSHFSTLPSAHERVLRGPIIRRFISSYESFLCPDIVIRGEFAGEEKMNAVFPPPVRISPANVELIFHARLLRLFDTENFFQLRLRLAIVQRGVRHKYRVAYLTTVVQGRVKFAPRKLISRVACTREPVENNKMMGRGEKWP